MTALSTLMALRRTFQLVSSSSEAPPSSSLNSCFAANTNDNDNGNGNDNDR